jgi:TetR/AcrR family transcriptional regulator, regulator of cefoperazone and chloramphenicol sensitivity
MAVPISAQQASETRQRLLEAAGEVFAERGFHKATVREICQRARANVAAVNYHFHNKQGLYAAVLKYTLRCASDKYALPTVLVTRANAAEQLRAIVAARLGVVFDPGRPAWHGKLMAREVIEPTAALEALVKDELEPLFRRLESCVRALLGPRADTERIRLCALSIASQWTFYLHARPVIARLHPSCRFGPKDIDNLADHIADFSLAALRQLKPQ